MRLNKWILATACLIFAQNTVIALPLNPEIIAGAADIQSTHNQCIVQSSDRCIIHWNDFSIQSNESVRFSLPSTDSAVLNRVVGGNPSEIFGQLHSNGSVYLINPNGILIGKEGLIHVGSLFASTLDVSNHDFLEGKELHFSRGLEAAIENQGKIISEAGHILLLAEQIKNEGDLLAPNGIILIGAGQEITYFPHGNEKIQIHLHPKTKTGEEPVGILQKGILRAKEIELKADGNLYSYAIKNEGILEASSIENRNGRIYLVAEDGVSYHSGSINADEVRILGQHIRIEEDAKIDVSSSKGGGTILIGGDYQGSNPEILNANTTFVQENVVLAADATVNGDGGKIILWADGVTGYYGTIEANGGPKGGDGGFVEISGKGDLDFHGLVHAGAPLGKNGTLLLDPANITISAAADSNVTFAACPVGRYSVTANTANILNTTLVTNLGSTCDIIISTTAAGTQTGTISVNSPIVWTSERSLTMNANAGITVAANITNTSNTASLTLNSGTTVSSTLTINAGATVSLIGSGVSPTGTLTLQSNALTTSDMTISGAVVATDKALTILCADDFTLTATTGSIAFNSPGQTFIYTSGTAAGSISNFNGPVTITDGDVAFTTGTLNFNDSFSTAGSGNTTINAGAAVITGTAGTTTHGSSGTFTLASTAGTAVTLGRPFVQTGGNVTINGGTSLSINNNYTNSSVSSTTTLKSGIVTVGTLSQAAGTTLSSTSSGTFTLDANTSVGSDITLSGAINITGSDLDITLNDDFTLTATTGSITFNSPGKTFSYTTSTGTGSVSNFNGTTTVTDGNVAFTTGTLNFNNSFSTAGSGNTTINAGGVATTGTTGTTTHGSSGTFELTSITGTAITLGRPFIQTGGAVTINGGAALTINSGYTNNTASSTTTLKSGLIAAGTLTFGASSALTYGSTGDLLLESGFVGDITLNDSVTITSANATISPADDFTLAAAGVFNYSATGKTLTFNAGPSTTHTFTGILDVTGGNLSITSYDDITISATTGEISYDVVGGTCQLIATGGVDPDVNINGTLNILNGTLTISTDDDILEPAGGVFNHSATGTANLTATSAITLSGTTTVSNGSMIMTAGTGISLGTGSTLTWTSPGTLDMTTSTAASTSAFSLAGTVAYSGGAWDIDSQGDVSITGFGVPFTYNPSGALSPFTILSHLGDITLSRSMTFTTPSAFSLTTSIGNLSVPEGVITNTLTGPWTFDIGGSFHIGFHESLNPVQIGSAGGAMQIDVGASMDMTSSTLTSGADATLGFSSGNQHPNMIINVTEGLDIETFGDRNTTISSNGTLTMAVGNDLTLTGTHLSTTAGTASISAYDDLTINAQSIILIGSPEGQFVHTDTLHGDLLFVVQKSLSAVFNTRIHNHGSGSITLVVDQQAPLSPSIGSGECNFFGTAQLETDGGPISIFAATPSQTTLPDEINGLPASDGTTVYNTWYSTNTQPGSFPYTIFYKSAGSSPSPSPSVNTTSAFHDLAFASAQVNQIFLDRTMGWGELTTWNACSKGSSQTYQFYQRRPFEYPLFVTTASCN